MKNYLVKGFLFGIISWLVPFVISFGFYKRGGELAIDYDLFKSLMVVVSTATGMVLLVLYQKHLEVAPVMRSFVIGLLWLAGNVLLDVVVLIPMSSMDYDTYFNSIGIRYLTIPVLSMGVGLILRRKSSS